MRLEDSVSASAGWRRPSGTIIAYLGACEHGGSITTSIFFPFTAEKRVRFRSVKELVTAAIGAFPDDNSYDVRVYVGNYSSERAFHRKMKVTLRGTNGKVLKEFEYEDLVSEPGRKSGSRKRCSWNRSIS